MTIEEKYKETIKWFAENADSADSELNYTNEFELLIAVILSAQCTDKRVNMITPALFKAMPDAKTMSEHSTEEILHYIKSISYPNSKAKHLHGTALMIQNEFNGIVPNNANDLKKLPGVGQKTANVMLAVAFGKPAMPVDTHVFRVSNRIGLTHTKTTQETEKVLVRNIPTDILGKAHHWLLLHGRYVCLSRKPKCEICGLKTFCDFYLQNFM